MMSEVLASVSSFLWGTPLLAFLLIANIILLYFSKLIPLRGIIHSLKLISGKAKIDHSHDEGQISHFQALCNALAATIGLGNISGVAVAIYHGGAGAIFWMWIAAFLGMNTKFFECSLAVMYRGKDFENEVQGGPMYFIREGMGEKYNFLSVLFAIFGLIGTLALFQINQMASFLNTSYGISNQLTGLFFALTVGYILFGGLKRISSFTSKVVPLMSGLYIFVCIIILIINIDKIPSVLISIFTQAFSGQSVASGAIGYGIMHVISTGVKRAAFSNEAGIGTAPMAHGNVKTSEPISEGYVAMLGPLIDTIIVCTLTATVILVSLDASVPDVNGINLTTYVFVKNLGEYGRHILGVIIFLFSFSTMIGMANYNKKCWDFLFKGKTGLNNKTFILFYCLSLAFAALIEMNSVVNLIDICYALMAVPNIIGTVYLARKVKNALNTYNKKYQL